MKINLFLSFIKSFFLAGMVGFICWWLLLLLFKDILPEGSGPPPMFLLFFIGGFFNAFSSFCLSVVAVIVCSLMKRKEPQEIIPGRLVEKFALAIIIAALILSILLRTIFSGISEAEKFFIIFTTNTLLTGFTVVWLFVADVLKAKKRAEQQAVSP